MNKKTLRYIQLILEPSVFSGIVTVLLTATILLVATLSYSAHNSIVYDFLFGPNSSLQLIQSSSGAIASVSNTVFGNPLLNKILYFLFWMIIGLGAYAIMHAVILGASSAAEDVTESRYVNVRKGENLHNIATRWLLRILFLAGWISYTIFFIKIFMPYSILAERVGVALLPSWIGFLYGLLGLVVLLLSIHVHTIFMRLMALSVRVFSSGSAEEADLDSGSS